MDAYQVIVKSIVVMIMAAVSFSSLVCRYRVIVRWPAVRVSIGLIFKLPDIEWFGDIVHFSFVNVNH